MKRKRTLLITAGIVLVLGGIIALYIYNEYNRMHKDTAQLVPDYSMTANGLIKEFEDDEKSSNEKYWNKVIQVHGIIKDMAKDEKGFYSVVLGDSTGMSAIRCSMDTTHNNEVASLKKGTGALMKGICTGFNRDDLLGSDVVLIRCVVDSKK